MSRSEIGFKFDKTENTPIDDTYIHENASIEILKLSLITKSFKKINIDLEKNRTKILNHLSKIYFNKQSKNSKKNKKITNDTFLIQK